MSKPHIEKPKVFISYAWGTREYQEKVLSLATDLVGDGIDVILDKWSLKEGNDTYAFMEQSVNDPTVTNVLLLLDPQYEKKANDRKGGVGTETQIISSEIYNKVSQDKFLPVVFERDEEGRIPKPTYLKSLLHFDLSVEERYDEEYQRLVKTLYGIEVYKKPTLGKKPDWLESESKVSTKLRVTHDELKANLPEKVKREKFVSLLDRVANKVISYGDEGMFDEFTYENYLDAYKKTTTLRDEYLNLISNSLYVEGSEKFVASNLEEILKTLNTKSGHYIDICKTLVHEIFIYVIAIYYKRKDYVAISYILSKTYFVRDTYRSNPESFIVFYNYNEVLDKAVNERDDKKYFSGTAQHWIDSVNTELCSKQDFVLADIMLYNISVYSENYINTVRYWFPLTYVYGGYSDEYLRDFAYKLCSREHLLNVSALMGYDDEKRFVNKMSEIESMYMNGALKPYGYGGAFDSAPLICQYIKSEDVGKYK